MKRRRRAQGLVEYGLIAATVALVGAAGLNALTTAQKNYFTDLPMNPPAPSAPGALLHPTSVDAPVCPQAPTVAIGQPIVCNAPVVRDTFSNASGRNPPWGTITLHMDTDPTVLATCILGHPPSGSLNTCGSNLSWTPTDTSLAGSTHTLSLWYGLGRGYVPGYPPLPDPESNHVASISSSLSITFLQYQFNGVPQCQNGSGNNHVEVGSPIRCTAAIYDTSTMGPPSVPVAVTWTAVNDPGNGTGSPYLSCSTGGNVANFGSMIWSNPATPACSPGSTLTCMTDASGACSVVFRRVRALMGASPLTAGYQDFTVSAFNGGSVTSGTVAWPGRAINIDPPSTAHPTTTLMMCTPAASGQPPGTIFSPPPATGSFMQRHASLTWTSDLYIRGPAGKGIVNCTATVLDNNPTPAVYCVFGPPWCDAPDTNPDAHNGHSPVGTVQWSLEDGATPIPNVIIPNLGSCTLQRLPVLAGEPQNQTPYASRCDSPPLPLAGLTNSELDNLVAKLVPNTAHIDSNSSPTTHVYFSP